MAKNYVTNPNFDGPVLLEEFDEPPLGTGIPGYDKHGISSFVGGSYSSVFGEWLPQINQPAGRPAGWVSVAPRVPVVTRQELFWSVKLRVYQQQAGNVIYLALWFSTAFTEDRKITGTEKKSAAITISGGGKAGEVFRPIVSARAPAGAVSAMAAIVCLTPTAGEETIFTFNEALLTDDPEVGFVYFDGDSPGCRWMAQPRASYSDNMSDNELYQRVLPVFAYDENYGFFGRYLCDSIMAMMQGLDVIVQDTPTHPGWGTILDPVTCPPAWLPWCAQLYGVELPPGLTVAEKREYILESPQQKRGTIAQLRKRIESTLTGNKWVGIQELVEGHPYRLGIQTVAAETPSVAATEEAIAAQKAGGLKAIYTSAGVTWAEATKKYSAVSATVTWENVKPGDV